MVVKDLPIYLSFIRSSQAYNFNLNRKTMVILILIVK